jgi:thiol-disulfide isomerase/thioredoxin
MLKNIDIDIQEVSQELKRFLSLYFVRSVELKIASEYSSGLMRTPVHLCVGQESIPVGLSEHLFHYDKVLSNHRSHGHYLAKGGSLLALFGEILGKQIGCAKGRGGSQHLIDLSANFIASAPILGGTIPIAAGVAFAIKLQETDGIVVVYLGDAVLEEGVLFETLSFASLHSLPILFVVENNRLSVHTHINQRQPLRKLKDIGLAFNLKSDEFDSSDIDEVSKIEKFFNININVYNNDISTVDEKGNEEYVVEIERRSMTNYETTLNLMRYENHFMYIKDLDHIRHSFQCRCCGKPCKKMKAFMPALIKDCSGKLKVIYVDYNNNPQLVSAMKVASIPALMLFQNGIEMKRYAGFVPQEDLKVAISTLLKP